MTSPFIGEDTEVVNFSSKVTQLLSQSQDSNPAPLTPVSDFPNMLSSFPKYSRISICNSVLTKKGKTKAGDEHGLHHSLLQKDTITLASFSTKPATTQNVTTILKSIMVQTCPDVYSHKNPSLQCQLF